MEYKIFGCKVNKYYTDKWLNSEYLKDKSGIFIASCVVTDQAKKKWIKFVKQTAKNIETNGKIYISGCGAFKDGRAQEDFFTLYPEIQSLQEKIEILGEDPEANIFSKKIEQSSISLIKNEKIENLHRQFKGIYTRKYILIQGGCDSFCSFCLTVIKRGKHFYRSCEDIRDEIENFAQSGGKEVVLTGVNLCAWGLESTNDFQHSRFAELLRYLLKNTSIGSIKISSLGPEFITPECLEIFKNERIVPHFHYSVQSGSTKILSAMRRHYDGEYIKNLLLATKNIQRDDGVAVSLGADIIVGFPGETPEDFMDTFNLIKKVGIQKVHAFPFSPHEMGESIPAGFFKEQIDAPTKKERLDTLLSLSDHIRQNFIHSQIGKPLKVLIEGVKGNTRKGWSQNYIECHQDNFKIVSGEIKRNSVVVGELILSSSLSLAGHGYPLVG